MSAESETGAVIARLRLPDLALLSKVEFACAPPPAAHELFLHPTEDAVILTMACGQDGTFVRIARDAAGRLEEVASRGGAGLEPCGVAGASADGRRVYLVSDERVEVCAWPDLAHDAEVELDDQLTANFAGAVLGGRLVVSAVDVGAADQERALVFDEALHLEDDAPAPPGMWAGALAGDRLVTIGRGSGALRSAAVYAITL